MVRKKPRFSWLVQSCLSSSNSLLQLSKVQRAKRSLILVALLFLLSIGVPLIIHKVAVSIPIARNQQTSKIVQQGRKLFEAGQFEQAASVWQQAAATYATQGDKLNQAMALSNLSFSLQQLGQWDKARTAIAQSLNILQTWSTTPEQLRILAQTLDIQGQLQLSVGQSEDAIDTWRQATKIYIQIGNTGGVTKSLINQAQAMQKLGLYLQAQETLTQVNQTLQNQPDSLLKSTGLRSLGNVFRVIGNLEQSSTLLQESLTIAQKLQSPQEISASLMSLGNTAKVQQDNQGAIAFYQQAATASPSQTTKLQAQLNQLNLFLKTQQFNLAKDLLPQIWSGIESLPTSHTVIYARINLAQSLMKQGRWGDGGKDEPLSSPSELTKLLTTTVQQARGLGDDRAEAYALASLGELYELNQQLKNAKDLAEQALMKAQAMKAREIVYRSWWQLGRLLKQQGDIQGAIASYTEAVNTLKSLRNDLTSINPDIQFDFRESVEPVYRQLVQLLLQPQGNSEPTQKNLTQAREVIESLQLAELENFFHAACLSAQPVLIDQVIDKDNSTAAVIYPIILADRLEVILKLPQQANLRHYSTNVGQSQVESTLEQLRQKLTRPYSQREVQSLANQVYNWVLRSAETDLAENQVKTLVFVLDGSLRNIPMAALYDGQQYLVQKYAIALTPGLQLLAPEVLSRQKIKALTAGLTEARQGFSALTNVKTELEEIKSEVPSTVLLNQKFTSTALQEQIDSVSFPVVHLATHGQFSSEADKTFILAWDKPINVNQLNELLRTRDVSRHNAIELLVLSACQTATGDKRAALGLAGVAVRAGARSTLASLWSLDDQSSALLMSQFYRELADTKVNKAEALRLAQVALLQSPRYQNPLYWAAYVLVGNWL